MKPSEWTSREIEQWAYARLLEREAHAIHQDECPECGADTANPCGCVESDSEGAPER